MNAEPSHEWWEHLFAFVAGYRAAVEWVNPGFRIDDHPNLARNMERECQEFFTENETDLEDFAEAISFPRAGHDFYLTREGHGTGFWDRGLGPLGQRLTEAAEGFGPDVETQTYL